VSLEDTIAAAVVRLIEPHLDRLHYPAVFTLAGAARYMHTSEKTVKQLVAQGDLPSIRVGEQYRIGKGPIDEVIARGAAVDFGNGPSDDERLLFEATVRLGQAASDEAVADLIELLVDGLDARGLTSDISASQIAPGAHRIRVEIDR
jgi:excisionase family DNA binding protein